MASKLPIFESPFESYNSLKIIGEGGAGRVYEVTNSGGEDYAIKVLVPERITKERLKRFKNEIEFSQQQIHKNIVNVIDTGSIGIKGIKCPFYVMPIFSGTLRTYMMDVNPEEVLQVFNQLLDGVEAAHLSKVWHRDIKPENVLWNINNNLFAVADFGIAHFEKEEIYTAIETKDTARMANFQYSAPEQRIRGEVVDHRSDIFSLGLILNELFTGEIPQGAGFKHIKDVNPDCAYLDEIVNMMVQQRPENRPNSIAEIKQILIGHQNKFVALQRLDEIKKQVISSSEPPEFEPITIQDFDFVNGNLSLQLSMSPPHEWVNEFKLQRGGHSSIMGYGPEYIQVNGRSLSVSLRDQNPELAQRVINNIKEYVSDANRYYDILLKEKAVQEDRSKRADYERKVAAAKLKKDILSNVSL